MVLGAMSSNCKKSGKPFHPPCVGKGKSGQERRRCEQDQPFDYHVGRGSIRSGRRRRGARVSVRTQRTATRVWRRQCAEQRRRRGQRRVHAAARCRATDDAAARRQLPTHALPLVASMQCRVPKGYQVLKEGLGSILKKGNDVFYNEAQAGAGSSWARVACHDGQAKAGVASKRVGAGCTVCNALVFGTEAGKGWPVSGGRLPGNNFEAACQSLGRGGHRCQGLKLGKSSLSEGAGQMQLVSVLHSKWPGWLELVN